MPDVEDHGQQPTRAMLLNRMKIKITQTARQIDSPLSPHKMNKRSFLFVTVLIISTIGCATYSPRTELPGKQIKGIVLNHETGEGIVGLGIHEYDRYSNSTLTDTSGQFEIEFLGTHSIVQLTGYGSPIIAEVIPDQPNRLTINHKTKKRSKRLLKTVANFNKRARGRWSKMSIVGQWQVVEINFHPNPQYDDIDKIVPDIRTKKLRNLFLQTLKISDKLEFTEDGALIVNNKEYGYSRGKKYIYLALSDVIYTYKHEFDNQHRLKFRKETTFGETEWTIKRM